MAKNPDKEIEVTSMFGDYNFSRAKAEGLWKKAGKFFKKSLARSHGENQSKESNNG